MKILAIRLKNLASLAGEQIIDFTAEPLASAGLFAITGPTGAGKSTILDALCLALFGSTPRLDSVSPLNKVPDVETEIGGGDERNLLRRGCGSGYAEVDFVGVDGHRYRARWEVRRAKEKIDGKLQASSQSLTDLDSGTLLASGKKREFKELLEARLGLTLAQFTRAVLLAQSEFSAFLKADDNERGTLLEKLTDTGLYSRLGQAAFEAAKQAKESLTRLEQQAGGLQPLEPEQREVLEREHQAQLEELKKLQQQLKELEAQRQWLSELQRLENEREAARQQLQDAEGERESLTEARRILDLFERLAPQRHRFLRQQELEPLLGKAAESLTRLQHEAQSLQQRLDTLQRQCEAAGNDLRAAEQARQTAEPRLAQARREEERLSHLNADLASIREESVQADAAASSGEATLKQLAEQQQRAAEQLATLTQQLGTSAALQPLCAAWGGYRPRLQQAVQLAARLQQGQGELPALEAQAKAAETRQSQAREALDNLQRERDSELGLAEQLAGLHRQLDEWRQAERETEALRELWAQQLTLTGSQRELSDAHIRQQAELDSLVPQGKQLRSDRDAAEQALKVTLALLERQRLARSENVEALRAALVPGEPCPVCGSDEHPWQHTQALVASLDQHDDSEAERARQSLQEQDQRLQELRDRHVALSTQLRQTQQRQGEVEVQLQALAPRLLALPAHSRLLEQPEAERSQWLEAQLTTLKDQIANTSQRQQQLLALQQRSETLQQAWQAAREACVEATQQLARQRDALARDHQQLDEELQTFAELLPTEQLQRWRENPAQTFMQLDTSIATRLQQLQAQTELADELRQCEQRRSDEQLQQRHRQEKQESCSARLTEREKLLLACQQALRTSLGEQTSASAWQQQLDATIQAARQTQAEIDRQLNESKVGLTRLHSEQQNCRQRQAELEQERDALNAELATWRADHPQLDDATLAQLLHMDDQLIAEARQRLRDNSENLTRCRERLDGCLNRLNLHKQQQSDAPDTEQLQQRHAEQLQQCEQADQRCAETRAQLIDDDKRRSQSQALLTQIDAARAEHQRWGRIAALIGSSDGGAFRKIAQAYNLDLLVQHANVQLRQLARRYRLKRGGSPLGLLVMDTEMGDELRSVHSLSGGETFLVSLALALGLASMASSKLKIESLFIDEGFGSLDPESLQIAMDALDSLQAQGRKVAVISHVAEMHERIPVQICVRRQGNGQSDLQIVGGPS
ncbi:exonuclease SbcC [Stutzerimonas stutzeri]|uniref:SbcC/MukB-like Walker B domain-containing protein n=1 Tax=Stutzerimonas stutzeri subgroup TaxID=578833 RepID=UPI000C6D0EE7|nr:MULTISPECIES: AAA family ATPase [Stutzerimonas stutzeri subgroup]MCQ2048197.1 AAA family ATPase [Stutzerimonas kunmingensis]PKR29489.1 exonuclease SbcC [Stutzerimonas stutzeri]QQC12359.1 AAA family ATPase [Stutzerimonas stutzeri]VEI36994.1 exonuclease SbcC [Stutzerimonas stutzeri]